MASLKLLFQGEWRRLPQAPETWELLTKELRDMYGLERPAIKEIGGREALIGGEREYADLLQRTLSTSTRILKAEVVEAPGELEAEIGPTFHLPQCARCLGRLSGREEIYILVCGHILCGLCFYKITVQEQSLCPHDGAQTKGIQRRDLQAKVQLLAQQLSQLAPPLRYQLPQELLNLHEAILSEMKVKRVQCSFFMKTGSCQDEKHCRYMHGPDQRDETTSFEAINMKDACSESVALHSREVDTLPIATEDSSTSSAPIPMQDQGSATVDHLDKASDGVLFIDRADVTVPVEVKSEGTSVVQMVNALQEAPAAVMESKECGPEALYSVCSQAEPQIDFYSSLRASIRMALSESVIAEQRLEEFPVTCSDCGISPIPEHYFKCSRCSMLLCPVCEEKSEHLHPFYKIKHLQQMIGVDVPQVVEDPLALKLISMGFKDKEAVKTALRETGGDFNRAVERLLAP